MTYRIRWAPPARRAIEHTLPEVVAAAVRAFAVGPLPLTCPQLGHDGCHAEVVILGTTGATPRGASLGA